MRRRLLLPLLLSLALLAGALAAPPAPATGGAEDDGSVSFDSSSSSSSSASAAALDAAERLAVQLAAKTRGDARRVQGVAGETKELIKELGEEQETMARLEVKDWQEKRDLEETRRETAQRHKDLAKRTAEEGTKVKEHAAKVVEREQKVKEQDAKEQAKKEQRAKAIEQAEKEQARKAEQRAKEAKRKEQAAKVRAEQAVKKEQAEKKVLEERAKAIERLKQPRNEPRALKGADATLAAAFKAADGAGKVYRGHVAEYHAAMADSVAKAAAAGKAAAAAVTEARRLVALAAAEVKKAERSGDKEYVTHAARAKTFQDAVLAKATRVAAAAGKLLESRQEAQKAAAAALGVPVAKIGEAVKHAVAHGGAPAAAGRAAAAAAAAVKVEASVPLKLTHEWLPYLDGYRLPQARRVGGVCVLGGLARTNRMRSVVARLPEWCRPARRTVLGLHVGVGPGSTDKARLGTARFDALPDGRVRWIGGSSQGSTLSLDGVVVVPAAAAAAKGGSALSLSPGWAAYQPRQWAAPRVVRAGQLCVLTGLLRTTGAFRAEIARLPRECTPWEGRLIFSAHRNGAQTARVDVLRDGRVLWVAGRGRSGWLSLDGISFTRSAPGRVEMLGYEPYGGAYRRPGFRVVGGLCVLSGLLKGDGAEPSLLELPEACRPKTGRVSFSVNHGGEAYRVDVLPDGAVRWVGRRAPGWIPLDGARLLVGPAAKWEAKALRGSVYDAKAGPPRPLRLAADVMAYGESYAVPQARRVGDLCVLAGLLRTNTMRRVVAVLPPDCRPAKPLVFDLHVSGSRTARVDVTPGGAVRWVGGSSSGVWLSLTGVAFSVRGAKGVHPLALGPRFRPYGGAWAPPSIRAEGRFCVLEGLARRQQWDRLVATLPVTCTPRGGRLIFSANHHSLTHRVDALPNGRLEWVAGSRKWDWISLSNVAFFTSAGDSLPLLNGYVPYGRGYRVPSYVRQGVFCALSGLANGRGHPVLARLPKECRPGAGRLIFDVNRGDRTYRLDVLPDGRVVWAGARTGGWLPLDGIRFAVAPVQAWERGLARPRAFRQPRAGAPRPLALSARHYAPYRHGYRLPQSRRVGALCVLSGMVRTNRVHGVLGVLPADCRPARRIVVDAHGSGSRTVRLDVLPNGRLTAVGGWSGATWLPLDGIVFTASGAASRGTRALALRPQAVPYGGAYARPSFRLEGDLCVLTGLVRLKSWDALLGTLPVSCTPRDGHIVAAMNHHEYTHRLTVLSDGRMIRGGGRRRHNWLSLDRVSFMTGRGRAMTLVQGYRAYGHGYRRPSLYRQGDMCVLSGLMLGRGHWDVARLPRECRPASGRLIFDVNRDGRTYRVDVLPDGRVLWVGARTGGWLPLDGIRFATAPVQAWERRGARPRPFAERPSAAPKPAALFYQYSAYGRGYRAPAVTRLGQLCVLTGLLKSSDMRGRAAMYPRAGYGGADTVTRVPPECRPARRLVMDVHLSGGRATTRFDVLPNGNVNWVQGATSSIATLDGLAYPVRGARPTAHIGLDGRQWRPFGGPFAAPSLYEQGDLCAVSGMLRPLARRLSGSVGHLPLRCSPLDGRLIFGVQFGGRTLRLDVLPDGRLVTVGQGSRVTWLSLDGVRFYSQGGRRLALLGGNRAYGRGYRHPQWRRQGRLCALSGLAVAHPRNSLVARLPPACRPASGRVIFSAVSSAGPRRLDLLPDGRLVQVPARGGWVSLDGLSLAVSGRQRWESAMWRPRAASPPALAKPAALRLASGMRAYGGPYRAPQMVREGQFCFLSGLVRASRSIAHPLLTLPPRCRPTARLIFVVGASARAPVRLDVQPNGVVQRSGGDARGSWIPLDGVVFQASSASRSSRARELPLGLGRQWRPYEGAYNSPEVVRDGELCVLSGLIRRHGRFSALLGVVPSECAPRDGRLIFAASHHERALRVDVTDGGSVVLVGGGMRHAWVSLDGVAYFTSNAGRAGRVRLFSGHTPYARGFRYPGFRKQGNVCALSGLVRGGRGASHILTVPDECRPQARLIFHVKHSSGTGTLRLDLLPDGRLLRVQPGGSPWTPLDGVRYTVADGFVAAPVAVQPLGGRQAVTSRAAAAGLRVWSDRAYAFTKAPAGVLGAGAQYVSGALETKRGAACPKEGGAYFKASDDAVAYICCGHGSRPTAQGWTPLPGRFGLARHGGTPCQFFRGAVEKGKPTRVCCDRSWATGVFVSDKRPHDVSMWTRRGGVASAASVTNEQAAPGFSSSLRVDSRRRGAKATLVQAFAPDTDGRRFTFSVQYYDDSSTNDARDDWVGLGTGRGASKLAYVMGAHRSSRARYSTWHAGRWSSTAVARSPGWHRFDMVGLGNRVRFLVDGRKVAERPLRAPVTGVWINGGGGSRAYWSPFSMRPADRPAAFVVVRPEPFVLEQGSVVRAAPLAHKGAYTMAFWVRPRSRRGGWHNLLHYGLRDNVRGPAVWFYPGQTRLHIRSAVRGSWNFGADPKQQLPLNRWTHVAWTHTDGRMTVYLNGKQAVSVPAKAPLAVSSPRGLYASNPWVPSADAELADLRWAPSAAPAGQLRRVAEAAGYRWRQPLRPLVAAGFVPRRGAVVRKAPLQHRGAYTLSFWVKPTARRGGWHNLLHHGRANGVRAPAVWFYPGQTRLHVRSSTARSWNFGADPPQQLPLNRWTHVAVVHRRGLFAVYLNGVEAARAKGAQPPVTGGVKLSPRGLYGSDPWYPSAACVVSDVRFAASAVPPVKIAALVRARGYSEPMTSFRDLHRGVWQPQRGRVVHAGVLQHRGSYTASVWVRPQGVARHWASLLHRGDANNQRAPGLWFYPGSTRLHLRSGTAASWNWGYDVRASLPLNRWTHVAWTHTHGRFVVYFNGKPVGRAAPPAPVQLNARHTYGSDPWSVAANAMLADLRWAPVYASDAQARQLAARRPARNSPGPLLRLKQGSWRPARGQVLTNDPMKHGGAYTLSFWLRPDGIERGWSNVFHRGNTNGVRAPAVWFFPRSTRLHVRSSTARSWNFGVDTPALPRNKWTHVAITHASGLLAVYLNGRRVAAAGGAEEPVLVTARGLWGSDPWHPSARTQCADLRFAPFVAPAAQLARARRVTPAMAPPRSLRVLHAPTFTPRRGVVVSRDSMRHAGAYTFAFWIKPLERGGGWRNVMHHGRNNGQRAPAVWLFPGSTRVHFRSAVPGTGNFGLDSPRALPLGRWSHVAFTHVAGRAVLYVDGRQVAASGDRRAPLWAANTPPLYGSNPWYREAGCLVSDVRFAPFEASAGEVQAALRPRSYSDLPTVRADAWLARRGLAVSRHPLRHRGAYTLAFWIRPFAVEQGWRNVLINGNSDGQRGPSIYFYPGQTRLHIRSAVAGSWNFGADPGQQLPRDRWTHVAVTHGGGFMTVYYDGKQAARVRAKAPLVRNAARMYAAGRWMPAGSCALADLRWSPEVVSAAAVRKTAADRSVLRPLPSVWRASAVVRKGLALSRQPLPHHGAYTFSVWVKPLATHAGWSNVLHRGNNDGQRSPAMWFYPGQTRLHIRSRVRGSWNFGADPPQQLPLHAWTHVAWTHTDGKMTVFYNGRPVLTVSANRPEYVRAPLWGSNPWYVPAHAAIGDVRYAPYEASDAEVAELASRPGYDPGVMPASRLLLGRATRPSRGRVLARPGWRKPSTAVSYAFWIKPTARRGGWHNVMHAGAGNGQRGPAVWFYPGQTRLHIRSAVHGAPNWGNDPPQQLPLNRWTHVAFTHAKGLFRVYYNGNVVTETAIGKSPTYYNAAMYLGDPWYPSASCVVDQLRYYGTVIGPDDVKHLYESTKR